LLVNVILHVILQLAHDLHEEDVATSCVLTAQPTSRMSRAFPPPTNAADATPQNVRPTRSCRHLNEAARLDKPLGKYLKLGALIGHLQFTQCDE
jgi:hypothetical protein